MASHFSSALAKLNDSLQTIQTEAYHLRRDLEADDDLLRRSLTDACHSATILSDLLCAERLNVKGDDRIALDQLVYELDIVARNQRRRVKLLDLAKELDCGRIKHHRQARVTALNTLRLEAVEELQAQAALADQEKDLPGPVASAWVQWTCSLGEERDADILLSLGRDFPAVERFIDAMEEEYWTPGEHRTPEEPLEGFAGRAQKTVAESASAAYYGLRPAVLVDPDRLARNLIALFEKIPVGAGDAEVHSLPHQHRPERASSEPETPEDETRGLPSTRPAAPIRIEKKRIDRRGITDFFRVVGNWGLSDKEARLLVGISDRVFHQLQRGEKLTLPADKLTRMSLVVGISTGLKVLYGRSRADRWVHTKNSTPMFDGQSPLKYMLKGGVDALVRVRDLVGVWASYSPSRK